MSPESPNKPPTILIVDDDELILSTLKGLFSLETDYEVVYHSDPREAIAEVERRPIDLVISDFLMPEMNGVELLKRIKQTQPEAVRILLTGFADKENAIKAINEVGLYRYLEKPWDNEDLLLLIRNALRQSSLRKQLSGKVAELAELIDKHSRLSDKHRLLERELEMAARVQRSLLPERLTAGEGYRCAACYQPSDKLGGDFYDLVQRPGETILLLADVSGHGLQAALTSMLLKASFQEAARDAAAPSELFDSMNARLHKFLPSGVYACASVLWVRPGDPLVQVANAGLPYPVVLRRDAGRVEELALTGMPLGLFPQSMPGSHGLRELEMRAGDVLVVMSDGLGDVRNPENEFLHSERLAKLWVELRGRDAEGVIEGLVEGAKSFSQGRSFPDDLSILALTRL